MLHNVLHSMRMECYNCLLSVSKWFGIFNINDIAFNLIAWMKYASEIDVIYYRSAVCNICQCYTNIRAE